MIKTIIITKNKNYEDYHKWKNIMQKLCKNNKNKCDYIV